MADIWRELRERYPLLERVAVYSVGEEIAEAIPHFFGLFLATLDDVEAAPCCFVLPRRGQMARLAATVLASSVFRREFDRLVREYAEQTFSEGQKVASCQVNTFSNSAVFWPDQPNKFCLCTLDGTGRTMFPASDVLRLEPTHRVTPRGKTGHKNPRPRSCPLDEILGIRMFGNFSLFKNHVVCPDEQIRFREFADQHELRTTGFRANLNLDELLPFGSLRDNNKGGGPTFENWSAPNACVEPLVAVTSSCERLAAFCKAAPRL